MIGLDVVRQATQLSVWDLFAKQRRIRSGKLACRQGGTSLSYHDLGDRAEKLAAALREAGVGAGDRVAVLSENGLAFPELFLACARLGAIVAPQNWRLAKAELAHCLDLVEPRFCIVSEKLNALFESAVGARYPFVLTGAAYEAFLQAENPFPPNDFIDPESGALIVYTSGTTGLPKGALISQRALIARAQQYCTEFGIDPDDTFYAYSPMFHIASADLVLATLMIGGTIVISDGLDPDLMRSLLQNEKMSNLIFFPGMVGEVLKELARMDGPVRSLKKFGALADLFPPRDIAALTKAVGTEFCNTFASTETGMMPACGGRIPIGEAPTNLAKTESNFCLVRLVDEAGENVQDGEIGELVTRGPTLFSGYWGNDAATRDAFANGWYHTGDLFRRNADGTLDYVDRKKYLVKSGGENIYPAEIERVVLSLPYVREALVVRREDAKWGEVPALVVAITEGRATPEAIQEHCLRHLAKYKCPKAVFFVDDSFWPRNNTGKILRRDVEEWVAAQA